MRNGAGSDSGKDETPDAASGSEAIGSELWLWFLFMNSLSWQ